MQAVYNITDFILAFILGVCFPSLLIASALRHLTRSVRFFWLYISLLTLSCFGVYFSLAQATDIRVTISFAGCFLLASYLWPFFFAREQSHASTLKQGVSRFYALLLTSLTLLFLIAVWFISSAQLTLLWAILASCYLLLAVGQIIFYSRYNKVETSRLLIQWLIFIAFCSYLYVYLQRDNYLIALQISLLFAFIFALINGSWFLVLAIWQHIKQLDHQISVYHNGQGVAKVLTDPITQLPNVSHLLPLIQQQLQQYSSQQPLAVIVIKPVDFKQVNDVLGNQNADLLLLQLAYNLDKASSEHHQLLNLALQPYKIARLTSLGFMVIARIPAESLDPKAEVEAICQVINEAVPQAISFKNFSVSFKLQFGVVINQQHTIALEQLISQALDAINLPITNKYQLVSFYDQQHIATTAKHLAELSLLEQAISQQQIIWLAQPQVAISAHKIAGFYLHFQWQKHTSDSAITQQHLLTLLNFSNQLYPLFQQYLAQAIKLINLLQQHYLYVPVAIGIDDSRLLEPSLLEYVEQELNKHKVNPKQLLFAIDEHLIVNYSTESKRFIDQLDHLQLPFAINRFSGSFEAIRYLRKLKAAQVWADCSNLNGQQGQLETDKAIINTIVSMAQNMEIPLIATNITTPQIEHEFKAMGGEIMQGNIISKPLPFDKIASWLSQWTELYQQTKAKPIK